MTYFLGQKGQQGYDGSFYLFIYLFLSWTTSSEKQEIISNLGHPVNDPNAHPEDLKTTRRQFRTSTISIRFLSSRTRIQIHGYDSDPFLMIQGSRLEHDSSIDPNKSTPTAINQSSGEKERRNTNL